MIHLGKDPKFFLQEMLTNGYKEIKYHDVEN